MSQPYPKQWDSERLAPRDREVAFRRLLQSVVAACNAVASAHSRGVVHRDLKPENIMRWPERSRSGWPTCAIAATRYAR